jgi:luciferase family oxidoreductase group 1
MPKVLAEVPVSVLDLATIVEGETISDAFNRSVALAQKAEALGYKRYWFAEHHNMETVASSATAVLIGHVAGKTSRIRVGSGGIMLPNHAPLIIAEQFGTLETMYPGRIDLGIGRAPGTDSVTAYALRRNLNGTVENFANDVVELINYLQPRDESARVRAIPGEGTRVPVWILGSSTYGAQLAAMLGLPFGFASHFAPAYLADALKIYRERFQPSQFLQEPYALACVNVVAAKTDEEAHYLATSFYQMALGMVRNKRRPLPVPIHNMDDLWTEEEQIAIQQMTHYSFIGSSDTVKVKLQDFLSRTDVDEIMVSAHIHGLEQKVYSYELIAPFFKHESKPALAVS